MRKIVTTISVIYDYNFEFSLRQSARVPEGEAWLRKRKTEMIFLPRHEFCEWKKHETLSQIFDKSYFIPLYPKQNG